jgi:hypothetical protein
VCLCACARVCVRPDPRVALRLCVCVRLQVPLLDIRHAQLAALSLPRVGMASAIDLGDPGCKAGLEGCMGVDGDAGLFGGHPRTAIPLFLAWLVWIDSDLPYESGSRER